MHRPRVAFVALVLTVILLPSSGRLVLVADADPYYSVGIAASDVFAAMLVLCSIGPLRRRLGKSRGDAVLWLAVGLGLLLTLAFIRHPSAQGAQTLFRVAAAMAVCAAMLDVRDARERRLILFALAMTAVTQTLLATMQLIAGDLLVVYEHPPIRSYGPFIRTAGTFPDTFVLAGFALVLASLFAAIALVRPGPLRWRALAALAIAPVGFSFSRAAAVAVLLLVAALLPGVLRRTPGRGLVLVALVVGVGIPALLTRDGWYARDDDSDVRNSASGRVELITQTLPLLASEPLLGIGPGNTMSALRDVDAARAGSVRLQPPHNVPYLIALEAGLPAGLVGAALLAMIGLRSLRRGIATTLVFLSLGPFLLLDNYPWTAAAGLPLVALWAAGAMATPEANAGSSGRWEH